MGKVLFSQMCVYPHQWDTPVSGSFAGHWSQVLSEGRGTPVPGSFPGHWFQVPSKGVAQFWPGKVLSPGWGDARTGYPLARTGVPPGQVRTGVPLWSGHNGVTPLTQVRIGYPQPGQDWVPSGQDWGTSPPGQDGLPLQGVPLATWQAVCLLRSRRRTSKRLPRSQGQYLLLSYHIPIFSVNSSYI